VRVQIVDPAAYTPPYDHALATALAAAGIQVDLITTGSPDWQRAEAASPAARGSYRRLELFYRHGGRLPRRLRQLARLLQHPAGLRRWRRTPADLAHLQWAPLQELDRWALPRHRPLVITAHDVLPRHAHPGQHAAQRAVYRRADAIVAHSEHGRARLISEAGVPAERIHVIPHGAFAHLAAVPPAELPAELAGAGAGRPLVVLSFGLIRPYKGTDVLLRAWRAVPGDAELWIVGRPLGVDLAELQALADDRVRFVPRFVTDAELAACFRAADLAVLPYREIEQSGVLATALAFGTPVLASAVGAFPEAAAAGAAALVPAGDEAALAAALTRLLAAPDERAELSLRGRELAAGAWSWETVARQSIELYEALTQAAPQRPSHGAPA
jgi:glycosyltransferase involved in cell wall biosynthesis